MKKVVASVLFLLLLGFLGVIGYDVYLDKTPQYQPFSLQPVANKYANPFGQQPLESVNRSNASKQNTEAKVSVPMVDFTSVAELVTPTVVHIKTKGYNGSSGSVNQLFDLFGNSPDGSRKTLSSGSGVILSAEGYIVTNKHVIEDATEITVIMHDREAYKAEVVGMDAHTDLAVLKIDAKNLPFITYGDSDKLKVGEWVIAVGNPFNLASTVTTGIVSAKTRKIGMTSDKLAIESFIQTDAAVNPGNSGGALVDLRGNLAGINTAIATPTGYYTGYSFALPVNIVKKVVEDILQFGTVKRGYLGVGIMDVTSDLAKEKGLSDASGVFISEVSDRSAAAEGGIIQGDVIIKVGEFPVNNSAELQEIVSRYRPGDTVKITLKRSGKVKQMNVKLKSKYE